MLSSEQRKFLEEATLRYMQNVSQAEEYLASRGISMDAAVRECLGVVVEPMEGHERRVGRLCIPYITDSGPVAMTFRCIKDHDCKSQPNHSKYLKPKGEESRLYGVRSFDEAEDFLCVAEGEFDALTLRAIGLPAIGVPGAKNWKKHWTSILQDFSRVYIFSDGDTAGQDFAERVMLEYDRSVNIPMPDGEDVNSAYLKLGKDFLLDRVKGN